MKTERWSKTQIITVVLTVIFIILSAFDSMEKWLVYMVEYQDFPAGTGVLIDSVNNMFPYMIGIGLVQIVFVLMNVKKCQAVNVVLAVIDTAICHRVFVMGIIGNLYAGGLGTYVYKLTTTGYIVLILSWILLLLHIRLYAVWRVNCNEKIVIQEKE